MGAGSARGPETNAMRFEHETLHATFLKGQGGTEARDPAPHYNNVEHLGGHRAARCGTVFGGGLPKALGVSVALHGKVLVREHQQMLHQWIGPDHSFLR